MLNPLTAALLERVETTPAGSLKVADLIQLAEMVQRGDLVHIDALPPVATLAPVVVQPPADYVVTPASAANVAPVVHDGTYIYRDGGF